MSADKALSWAFAEEQSADGGVIAEAQSEALDMGITPMTAATGSLLRVLVAATRVTNAVEVGTGTGVSGLYLLGSGSDVNLTTIDVEPEAQRVARTLFSKANVRSGKARIINGRSADILPRLADQAYDLVLLDGDPQEMRGDVSEALRLLRPGGLLLVNSALLGGRVADPARREDDVVSLRELNRDMLTDETLVSALVPVGDGLLVCVKQG